jgi:hypothetical protein
MSMGALTATVALAACGSSSNVSSQSSVQTVTETVTSPSGPAPAATRTQATTTASTVTTTTTAAGSSTPAPASGSSVCVAADLKPVSLGSNGAAGTVYYTYALENVSSSSCHTYGWPGVSFWTASGKQLPNAVSRVTSDQVGNAVAASVTIAPGGEVSFRVDVEDAYDGGAKCTTASYIQFYAPDDTTPMRLSLGSGAQSCGAFQITPLQSGRGALAGA